MAVIGSKNNSYVTTTETTETTEITEAYVVKRGFNYVVGGVKGPLVNHFPD